MDLIERLKRKDQKALAKLITQVENRAPGYQEILDRIFPYTGKAFRIGITGPPGSGKSTLVDKLVPLFRTEGKSVGILACDPTSPFSGGALLGDRIRMRDIALDEGVFIRSMATRGSLGGLAHATQEVTLVLEAYGMDIIILETIGVGQAEVDVVQAADSVVVVLVPQSGDAIQAMKAGLMEIADVFVINKCDQGGADLAYQSLQSILSLLPEGKEAARQLNLSNAKWTAPIVKTIAPESLGIMELKEKLEEHQAFLESDGLTERRQKRLKSFLKGIVEAKLQLRLWNDEGMRILNEKVAEIIKGNTTPYRAAKEILTTVTSLKAL